MKIKIKAALFHKNEDCLKKWLKSITLINKLHYNHLTASFPGQPG